MSLVITQRPQQTISGETSNWNAVGNPILYKFQRKDYVWNTLNDTTSTFVRIFFTGVYITTEFSIGDEISVFSNNGLYTGQTGEITSVAFTAGNTVLITDITNIGNTTNGFLNKLDRSLYRLELTVYNSDDEALTDAPFVYSSASNGTITVNVSSILKTHLSPDNDNDLTGSTEVFDDANAYINFYIKCQAIWAGGSETEIDDVGNQYMAVMGAMQIPSLYGGNMALYVTFEDGVPKGLFLNKLIRPKLFKGYPFVINAIVGDTITVETFFGVQYLDKDGNILASGGTPEEDYSGKIIGFIPNNMLSIPSDAVTGRIWLANYDTAALITDYLYFDIVAPCKNPILLMARNSLGGVLQWLFDYSQEYTHDYGDGRKAKRKLLSVKGLTLNEWEALQDFITLGEVYKNNIVEFTSSTIKTSTRIGQQVYEVFPDGSKIGVIVIPTRNTTLTKQIKHTFEIEIEYPEEFTP